MKTKLYIIAGVLALTSCESPAPSSPGRPVRPVSETRLESATGTGHLTANRASQTQAPPAYSPGTSSLPPADVDVIYQERESDIFGSSSYSTRTQVRGPVVEEVHIGNQRVYRSP